MQLQLSNSGKKITKQELGNGRKVRLKPGKGLIDWVQQSNKNRLTNYPIMQSINEHELSKHNTILDCWILLFDTVYDVTYYLEFHPGGINEIMRAAGTDATYLFNDIHQWVNYRSMLKSCVIGPFNGNRLNLRKPFDEGTEV